MGEDNINSGYRVVEPKPSGKARALRDKRFMYLAAAAVVIIAALILFYPKAAPAGPGGQGTINPPATGQSAAETAFAVASELYALTRYIDVDFENATLTVDSALGPDSVLTELGIGDGFVTAKVTSRSTQAVEIAKSNFGGFATTQGYRLACTPAAEGEKFTLRISKKTDYEWDTDNLELAAVTTLDIEGCGSRIKLKSQTPSESFTGSKALLGAPEAFLANVTWYRFQQYVDTNGVNGSDPGSLISQAALAAAPGLVTDFAAYLKDARGHSRCEGVQGGFAVSYKNDAGKFVPKFAPGPQKTAMVWLPLEGAYVKCSPPSHAASGGVVMQTGDYIYEIPGPKFGLNLSKIM